MKRTRLNHARVNALLSEREMDFNLPGGINQTPVRVTGDGQIGLSDFNRFYVTNAVKAYLGMTNEFDPEGRMSKDKLNEKVIDTLKHYDLLLEEDMFYGLFRMSQEIKKDFLTLEDGDILENQAWDEALEKAAEAVSSLHSIKENRINNGEPMSSIIETIKADLKKVGESNNISYEDLINELNH